MHKTPVGWMHIKQDPSFCGSKRLRSHLHKIVLFPNEENGDQHKHLRPSNTLTEWPPPSSTCNRRNCITEQLKQPSKHSRWSRLTRLPPMGFEILHLAWYAPTYIKEPKMLNIRGKPNIYKIQTLLFWTNLVAITEECFLWLLLCSLPFIYIEKKANNIFLPF